MARIRSTHPGQWTDDDFVTMSYPARLLAIGIRNEADDQGVFVWKPIQIKMKLFPADDVDVVALLGELIAARQVCRFEAGGETFGALARFCQEQRPRTPVAEHPKPPEHLWEFVGLRPDGSRPAMPLDAVLRAAVFQRDGRSCAYCRSKVGPFHIDHIHPRSKGGRDEMGNLVVACRFCNLSKGAKDRDKWVKTRTETAP